MTEYRVKDFFTWANRASPSLKGIDQKSPDRNLPIGASANLDPAELGKVDSVPFPFHENSENLPYAHFFVN